MYSFYIFLYTAKYDATTIHPIARNTFTSGTIPAITNVAICENISHTAKEFYVPASSVPVAIKKT